MVPRAKKWSRCPVKAEKAGATPAGAASQFLKLDFQRVARPGGLAGFISLQEWFDSSTR